MIRIEASADVAADARHRRRVVSLASGANERRCAFWVAIASSGAGPMSVPASLLATTAKSRIMPSCMSRPYWKTAYSSAQRSFSRMTSIPARSHPDGRQKGGNDWQPVGVTVRTRCVGRRTRGMCCAGDHRGVVTGRRRFRRHQGRARLRTRRRSSRRTPRVGRRCRRSAARRREWHLAVPEDRTDVHGAKRNSDHERGPMTTTHRVGVSDDRLHSCGETNHRR